MPPRSFLEVVGSPTVQLTDCNVQVLKIPLRISCNLFTPTIEKSRASRKTQLSSMLNHSTAEIHRDLDALLHDPRVAKRAKTDVWCAKNYAENQHSLYKDHTVTEENSLQNSGMVKGIKRKCAAWITAVRARDAV
mmetsp:Transcript_55189/g.81044  ORF Transcript_55189/g.81044 Transcript_55189/m.81044 type:complete len:135 (+) Transcript_55189:224-628(+)